ncbi:hypothetical protein VTI74DRAFT_8566 [Chaetomium olivicolor]
MSLATAAPSKGDPTPTLAEPSESEPATGNATPRATDGEEKKKKRSLFGFGKKKTEEPGKSPTKPAHTTKAAPITTTRTAAASPIQTDHSRFSPSSPGRPLASSPRLVSSPRLSSPAGSQIFERDVQESTSALIPNSPAIPSHIQTENYIPPVLDASSEAITDDHLDPDNVEIITHTSHQPASVAVAGLSPYAETPHWADELAAFSAQRAPAATTADTASNYGSFDTTDVRRLSFISFADVVQAEQAGQFPAGSRDSIHLAGLTSLTSSGGLNNRSPSPIRSPVSSSGAGASPPTSKSGSVKGLEMAATSSPASVGSGNRRPLGSPKSMVSMTLGVPGNGPTVSGEIAIETMTQALRRTGSGDLSCGAEGGRRVGSFPVSPI